MQLEPAIEARGLGKSFGSMQAVADVDLRVEHGNVFALLGPNGAGKTTTVRILATLLRPDRGEARVAGFDVVREQHQVRRQISLTGQYAALDELQTGDENLRMIGRLSGLSGGQARARSQELLRQFELVDAAKRKVTTYSGGMRRRLDLAVSLVGRPSVIFLDEPTTGLDPRSRQTMRQIIASLVASGVTVFLTTQYLEEADQLADRIAVIDRGRLVAEGTPAELKQRVADQRLDLTIVDDCAFDDVVRFLGTRAILIDPDHRTIGVATDGSAADIRRLLDEIDPHALRVERFEVHSATLDDVFFALTGQTSSNREGEVANV
ncbi:MAG TPA: ATP-binding cassette domain-containing protein [Nitrolancea sp.]|nr:ATP-binding cassette domain-containing protein [Nitrolancea sp.]